MSYIVPKEKPKCYNCPFRTLDYCGLLIEHDCVTVNVNKMTASEYCPLIELPFAEELAEKLYKQIEKAVIEGSET